MKIKLVFLMLLIFPLTSTAETTEEKGLRISSEAEEYDTGFVDFVADMRMILRNRKGDKSERKITIRTLEVLDDGDKSMSLFHEPADVRGTAMLTYSHGLKADDQWLFLPALKRIKRISSRNKSGPFMGSEFAFEDLSSQEISKYTYNYVKEEACGDWICHVIERKPVYKYSGYTRQLVWLDKDKYRVTQVEFYDRKNKILKTLESSDYKEFLGHYWRPLKMDMSNHQTGKGTTLLWENYQFKTGLRDRDFKKNKLKSLH